MKPLDKDTLLNKWQFVQILRCTHLFRRETAHQQDKGIDRDGKVGDKRHDLHPIADTTCTLCKVSSSILANVLELDLDFEQVGEEGEKRGKGERRGEKCNEAKLDYSFVVIGSQ